MAKKAVLAAILLLLHAPALALDWDIGLRWNWIQMNSGTEFWDDYVQDKWMDEYEFADETWEDSAVRGNVGLVDDFNGPNAFPGVKLGFRMGQIQVDALDIEYFQRERRITNYAYQARRTHQPDPQNNYQLEEWLDLTMIQMRHSVYYVLEHQEFDYMLGGGLNWTMWETESRLQWTDYSTAPAPPYPSETWTDGTDGINFGAHLSAVASYSLTEKVSPFFGLTYLYSTGSWDYPRAFDQGFDHDSELYRLNSARQDSYDFELTGLRIDFGLTYRL